MADTYIKSFEHSSLPVTIRVDPNTGTTTVNGQTMYTHTVTYEIGNLDQATFAASGISGGTGSAVTDAALAGLGLTYFTINGGDPIYSPDFTKVIASSTLTITDGSTTMTNGDTIDVYYMSTFTTEVVRQDLLVGYLSTLEQALRDQIDQISNVKIHSPLINLGFTRD